VIQKKALLVPRSAETVKSLGRSFAVTGLIFVMFSVGVVTAHRLDSDFDCPNS
jgi:hypothetical protein